MPWTNPFSTETFQFLVDLGANNHRDWFQANKPRYEELVKHPSLQLISDFGPRLRKISPHFQAIPKVVGGSLMRIYRDTRFSRDKTPYKTNIGIRFPHVQCKEVRAPGLYLHLEPGECFIGVGAHHPESATLRSVRSAIVEDPTGWKRASRDRRFRELYELSGTSLKRPPRGFEADHPLVEDLKRKDFVGIHHLADDEALSAELLDQLDASFRRARPFMRFLCGAVGAEF